MSGFKRLIAGIFLTSCVISSYAFHYSVYEPVKSTAYEPNHLKLVKAQSDANNLNVIDAARTPNLITLHTNTPILFTVGFINHQHKTISNLTVNADTNTPITIIKNNCGKQLAFQKSCQMQIKYMPTRHFQNIQNYKIPLIIHYIRNHHHYVQRHNVLMVFIPKFHFFNMPVQYHATPKGIASNYIKSLFLDKNNHLLVGSDGGLSEGIDHNHLFKTMTR